MGHVTSDVRKIAKIRIEFLFKKADEIYLTSPVLAHRYVKLARSLAQKVRLRIPRELQRKFCKHCYKYLRSGKNARVRTREGKLIIYCLECKHYTRIPLK